MISFEEKFSELEESLLGTQKKLPLNIPISVFYGLNTNGNYRIAFLTESKPPVFNSTKVLKINQGIENNKYYWTSIDLVGNEAKQVFYVFCDDLIDSIKDVDNQLEIMNIIHNRYVSWSKMFSKEYSRLSEEKIKGLIGELFFIKNYLIPKYSVDSAIMSWSGPLGNSKDFSIENTWYEVKAVSIGNQNVKISSIYQLDATSMGHLVIVNLEKMSESYSDGQSSIKELFNAILSIIKNNDLKDKFISKVILYGFDYEDENISMKYSIKKSYIYGVDDSFPRIVENSIPVRDIARLSYELIIKNLEKYKVEEL